MARYFFHITHGLTVTQDAGGIECPDDDAAFKQATIAAGKMLKDIDGALIDPPEWKMEVVSDAEEIVCVLHFSAERRPR